MGSTAITRQGFLCSESDSIRARGNCKAICFGAALARDFDSLTDFYSRSYNAPNFTIGEPLYGGSGTPPILLRIVPLSGEFR